MNLEGLSHKRHNDDRWIDSVVMYTQPRYKTSGLSGDEWRTGAVVQLVRKDLVVYERRFRDVDTAARWLAWGMVDDEVNEGIQVLECPDDFCDQVGCAEKADTFYRIKTEYNRQGEMEESQPGNKFRQFCRRHSERGDSDMEDQDANYEFICGEPPSSGTRNSDEANPAMFLGTIDWNL